MDNGRLMKEKEERKRVCGWVDTKKRCWKKKGKGKR